MQHWLPENIATYGNRVDGVIQLIFAIVGLWFVAAMGLLLFFAIRYRHAWHRRAAYAPARTRRGMALVLVPVAAVFLFDVVIDAASTSAWDHIKVQMPQSNHTVRIVGKQYVWTCIHPGLDGVLDTADDIVETNALHVPAGEVVRFELQAEDVIHSFFVPNLRLKQDCVPGRTIAGWFEASRAGTYQLLCAELCGIGHTNMRGRLEVHSPEDYSRWVTAQAPPAGP
jgi:cytochrome c oxidase subunit 2